MFVDSEDNVRRFGTPFTTTEGNVVSGIRREMGHTISPNNPFRQRGTSITGKLIPNMYIIPTEDPIPKEDVIVILRPRRMSSQRSDESGCSEGLDAFIFLFKENSSKPAECQNEQKSNAGLRKFA